MKTTFFAGIVAAAIIVAALLVLVVGFPGIPNAQPPNSVTTTTPSSTPTSSSLPTTPPAHSSSSTSSSSSSSTKSSSSSTSTQSSVTPHNANITVFAHRVYNPDWAPCFALTCMTANGPGTGPGAWMFIALYNSTANYYAGRAMETGLANEDGLNFTGLTLNATYYVNPDDCSYCHGADHNVTFAYWGSALGTPIPNNPLVRPIAVQAGSGAAVNAWYVYIPFDCLTTSTTNSTTLSNSTTLTKSTTTTNSTSSTNTNSSSSTNKVVSNAMAAATSTTTTLSITIPTTVTMTCSSATNTGGSVAPSGMSNYASSGMANYASAIATVGIVGATVFVRSVSKKEDA